MTDREFLRHTVATVSYRAAEVTRGAPSSFADFRAGPASRTAVEILAHMGNLFEWALSMASGTPKWNTATPLPWDEECARFFRSVSVFDEFLASGREIHYELIRLFQGPVADALTHIGQLAMLRRLNGAPIKGESYDRADIVAGRVGAVHVPPDSQYEFE